MSTTTAEMTRPQRRKQCSGKFRFATYGDASNKVRVHRWRGLPGHERVRAYYCEFCEGWHVGRSKPGRAEY